MIAAAVVITLLYILTILFLLYGFYQVQVSSGSNSVPETSFSIIIPYRNEAENLPALFQSLLKLKYPSDLFEIIAVNDASEDDSVELWKDFRKQNPQLEIHLLESARRSGSPKKDAIEAAVSAAVKEYIITTDADCEVPKEWLLQFDHIILEKEAAVIAAPVAIKTAGLKTTFLRGFQELDFFSLQAATVGGFGVDIPFMCNGANFCYQKKAFIKVNGFIGNKQIASGDDIFLMEKFRKEGLKMVFLKSPKAIVLTQQTLSWRELFYQRVRWAAKTTAYNNFFSKWLGVLVLAMNLLIAGLIISVLAGYGEASLLLIFFLLKFNADFIFIYSSAKFFGRERVMKNYLLSSLLYPFFSSGVALISIFSGYTWKGRHFKK